MPLFVVHVPDDTSPWAAVFLAGTGDRLGRWRATGWRLDRWDDGVYRGDIDVPPGTEFLVTRGHWRAAEVDGDGRERPPRVVGDGDVVEVRVAGWGRGSVRYHPDFPSRFLPHRRPVTVHLPPGYDLHPGRRYPVLYLHDGQNLFDAGSAFAGVPWGADEAAEAAARRGDCRPVVLVGVGNTPDRLREYGPGDAPDDLARAYGRHLVAEVKPFVDAAYRTLPGPAHAGVGGSSMGGLISLYLCEWYPAVFGRCAALSPSLWWNREHVLRALAADPRALAGCRVWADMGTHEGPTRGVRNGNVRRARRLARLLGRLGPDFRYHEAAGAEHTEAAWAGRFADVLAFLFPPSG